MRSVLLAILLASALSAQTRTAQTKTAQTKTDPTKPTVLQPKSTAKSTSPTGKAGTTGSLLNPASLNRTAPATYRVKLATTKGDIIIDATRAWAPRGADRFYNLVRAGFYTDAPFFRVIPGFMAQFGISARPDVNKAWRDANLIDDPVKTSNTRGKVTYAAAPTPNTRTTQLFINTGNNTRLDADRFAPFGEVVEGMDVVDKLYSGYGGDPNQDALQSGGKAWVDKNMPKVDRILSATIVPPAAAAPKPAAPDTKK